jgi:hypothetical protein
MGGDDAAWPEPRKVAWDGARTAVRVEAGRGDDLVRHLAEFGIAGEVRDGGGPGHEWVEFGPDADHRVIQPVVDRWPG